MKRRLLGGTLWVKITPVILTACGVAYLVSAVFMTIIVLTVVVVKVTRGMRENYYIQETQAEKRARMLASGPPTA